MKHLFSTLAIVAITSILLTSCRRDDDTAGVVTRDIDMQAFWECHNSQPNDAAALTATLTSGKWLWLQTSCYGFKEQTITPADKTTIITFSASGTFTITENDVARNGTWKLVPSHPNDNKWELETDIALPYFHGYILSCENDLMFSNSYVDGCDNLFTKTN